MYSFAACAAFLSLASIPVAHAVTWNITVGGTGILRYNPEYVNASIGDTVQFTFLEKNHTATQSSFADPCAFLQGGFDSGFHPVADNFTGPFPTASYSVETENPLWFYCRQTGHCAAGMVFAVNPAGKFPAFQAAAETSNTTSTSVAPPTGTAVTVTATVTATADSSTNVWTTTYGSYPGSAEPTSAASTNYVVVVGGEAGLVYTPANISAQPGDTVTFQFQTKNHTVTQSSFAAPCEKLQFTSPTGEVGFDSGFMPVSNDTTDFPTFNITVNDTAPVWVYCRQTGHCGQGMVFAVNAVATSPNSFAAFQASAIRINGTSTNSSSAPSATATSSSTSGAISVNAGSAGVALALVSAVFGLML